MSMNHRWPTTAVLRVAAVCAVSLLWALPARAVQMTKVEHNSNNHTNVEPFTISRADCVGITTLIITLASPVSSEVLSWWVTTSGDCTLGAQRNGVDKTCYQVGNTFSITQPGPQTLTSSDIANALPDVDNCVDQSGIIDKRGLDLYLLVNAAGNDLTLGMDAFVVDDVAPSEIDLDSAGPNPPVNVKANIADDNALLVSFDDPMSDVDLFYVYCAPAATAATGAGGSTTTGTAAGGAGGAVTGSGGAMGGAGGGRAEPVARWAGRRQRDSHGFVVVELHVGTR